MRTESGAYRKRWCSLFLVLILVVGMFTGLGSASAVQASEKLPQEERTVRERKTVWYSDISSFKAERTYPREEGYVFAGWYTDSNPKPSLTNALKKDVKTGGAYALFVDEDVLQAAWQIDYRGKDTGGLLRDTDMRLITTVDSLCYDEVGFSILYNNEPLGANNGERTTKTVYRELAAFEGGSQRQYGPEVFSSSSEYFMSYRFNKIPDTSFGYTFQVTPFWTTLDGTRVYGRQNSFNIYKDDIFRTLPKGLIKTGFSDFGLEEGAYRYTGGLSFEKFLDSSVCTSVVGTDFAGTVTFEHDGDGTKYAHFRYGGHSDAWDGMVLEPMANGKIGIWAAGGEFSERIELDPEIAGTPLVNEEIELRLAMWEEGNHVRLAVYINGKLYGNEFIQLAWASGKFGTYMRYYVITEGGPGLIVGSETSIPNRLTQIDFSDFGLAAKKYVTGTGELAKQGTVLNTSLRDNITFFDSDNTGSRGEYYICYGANGANWDGLRIQPISGTQLRLYSPYYEVNGIDYTLDAAAAGVDSFLNQEFTLGIDLWTKYSDHAYMKVYINGKCYEDKVFKLKNAADGLFGSHINFITIDENKTFCVGRQIPADAVLRETSFADFGVVRGEYQYRNGQLSIDAALNEGTILGTRFQDEVTFCYNGDNSLSYLCYGGSPSSWHGIRIEPMDNDCLKVYAAAEEFPNNGDNPWILTSDKAGASLVNNRILLTLVTWQDGQDVKLAVYINHRLYGGEFFTLEGAADKLGGKIGYYAGNEGTSLYVGDRSAEAVMSIGGYYGPHQSFEVTDKNGNLHTALDMVNDDIYKKIADCGVNLITYNYVTYPAGEYGAYGAEMKMRDQLKLADQYGISMYVNDERLYGKSSAQVSELISKAFYSEYASFAGIHVVDEPCTEIYRHPADTEDTKIMSKWAELSRNVGAAGTMNYVNLLPYWPGILDKDSGRETSYKRYLQTYIDTCAPKQLSFDYYVFDPDREHNVMECGTYFKNLAMIREKALEQNLPFSPCIQAGTDWNGGLETIPSVQGGGRPTEAEFKWNVNVSLAFGAQGIQYFPLIQPIGFAIKNGYNHEYDYGRNGLIGANGQLNDWYYYAQRVNRQIAAVDDVLMNAASLGVIVGGEIAEKSTIRDCGIPIYDEYNHTHPVVKNVQITSGNVMTGLFDYQGKTAMYIVNYNLNEAGQAYIYLRGNQHNVRVTADGKNFVGRCDAGGAYITEPIAPGEAILVVID